MPTKKTMPMLKPCRKCKEPVQEKSNTCSNCGANLPDLSTVQLWFGSFMLLTLAGVIFHACANSTGSEFSDHEIKKGFHCLSAWDGSHAAFKREAKSKMRDPKSFEHVETRIGPVKESGKHIILMDYRAKNGFGGLNLSTATGTVDNSNCQHKVITLN